MRVTVTWKFHPDLHLLFAAAQSGLSRGRKAVGSRVNTSRCGWSPGPRRGARAEAWSHGLLSTRTEVLARDSALKRLENTHCHLFVTVTPEDSESHLYYSGLSSTRYTLLFPSCLESLQRSVSACIPSHSPCHPESFHSKTVSA